MKVSIIIPTRNRANLLSRCLRNLVKQINSNDQIVVIDNASTGATKEVIQKYSRKYPIKYLYEPKKGPSFARNLGIKRAEGEILAFLDDDCVVKRGWLRNIKKNYENEKGDNIVYQGKINHIFPKSTFLTRIFRKRNEEIWKNIKKEESWKEGGYVNFISAGNFFLRKSILKSLSLNFDAKIFPYHGEQQDLAYRLQTSGYLIKYLPQVEVDHIKDKPVFLKSLKNAFFYGRTKGVLEKRYLSNRKARTLFHNYPKTLDKKSGPKQRIISISQHFRSSLLEYLVAILYLSLYGFFFTTGKIYGHLYYRLKVSNLK